MCIYICIVNNIPHGHTLFSISWYSLVTRGTRCAQKSMSTYNTCDHLGSSVAKLYTRTRSCPIASE